MSLVVNGKQIRKSTGTEDKEEAKLALANTRIEITKRKLFDIPEE